MFPRPPTETPLAAAAPLEVLVFEVEGQRFGLLSDTVQELQRMVAVVPLPRAPAIIEGIINLRGRIVPVLDIRTRFRLSPRLPAPSDQLVIAWAGERLIALRVDRALELIRLAPADVEDARGAVPGAEYVAWVTRQPGNMVLIHDLRTFLSHAEAEALNEVLPDVAPAHSEERRP